MPVLPKSDPNAKPMKMPTFAAKVKALLPPPGTPKTRPYDHTNTEMTYYLDSILRKIESTYKSWNSKKADQKSVESAVAKAPDAIAFLKALSKIMGLKITPLNTKGPLKPGQMIPLVPPEAPLSAHAQTMKGTPEAQAIAAALVAKIEAYEAEITRLKKAREEQKKEQVKTQNKLSKLNTLDEQKLKYFSYIDHHCSDFVKIVRQTKKFLFRGQGDSQMPIFIGRPRTDRMPKDSDEDAQKLLDEYLTLMGFKALRSNSIFTTSDEHQASGYGNVYAIFPKNGFEILWSPSEEDLVIHSVEELNGDDAGGDWYYDLENITSDFPNDWSAGDLQEYFAYYHDFGVDKAETAEKTLKKNETYKALKKALRNWDDTVDEDTDMQKMIAKFTTIMGYYDQIKSKTGLKLLTATHKKNARKYLEQFKKVGGKSKKEIAAKVIKRYGFIHDKLDAALKSGNEVCIFGEYVAVRFGEEDQDEEDLKKYFIKDTPKVAKPRKPTEKKPPAKKGPGNLLVPWPVSTTKKPKTTFNDFDDEEWDVDGGTPG